MKRKLIVVLADGETWSELEGCKVVEVDESQLSLDKAKYMEESRVWNFRSISGVPFLSFFDF